MFEKNELQSQQKNIFQSQLKKFQVTTEKAYFGCD